jgi:predicted nucleotidyltransferase
LTENVNKMIFSIGNRLRELRKTSGLTLRQVAAASGIDPAVLSKMERGQRRINKAQLIRFAELYKADIKELMVLFLGDKVLYDVRDEDFALKALKVAELSIQYGVAKKRTIPGIKKICKEIFSDESSIEQAWIFGSFARKEQGPGSDIDIIIRLKTDVPFSLYDMAEVQYKLEKALELKVDLVELESLPSLVRESIAFDKILIYG